MADAEKKDIARLDFKIDDAKSKLESLNTELEKLAKSSESCAKQIGTNINNAIKIDSKTIINSKDLKKEAEDAGKSMTQAVKKSREDILSNDKIYHRKSQLAAETHEQKMEEYDAKRAIAQEKNNQKMLNSTKTLYDKINDYAKTYLIYQGFNQLKKGISETIDEMVEVEYQMVQIDRVLNDSSLNIDKYRDKLMQLAYDYGNSFDNVADITLRLAQAGYDTDEALALSEKTLLALNTAELDATQATEDMVAVMAQWGLMTGTASEQAKSYGDIIDKINKVADNFPTTSEDILEALKKTSSAFNLAGASIDETIATIVAAETASQRGGKAIGTALSNIIQQLKEAKKLEIAESLGLDFYTDSTKKEFKDIMTIFQELSERMQSLKDAGKESSVEMQNLLSIFTVFRRNIGASLLGEMAGEDSTYAQVLETSLNSVGYSIQENTKHMETAKAAQAQFNAELLKLKTQVWDSGLEDVFRDLLSFGTDLVGGISKIIDKFGLLPSAIGVATLAYTSLNKSMKAVSYNAKTNSIEWAGFMKTIADGTKGVREANAAFKTMRDGQIALTAVQGGSIKAFGKNVLEVGKYTTSLVLATAKTIALQVATIALNTALSMGISFAITALVSKFDEWSNASERAVEANNELMETSRDNAQTITEEITSIQELRKEYEELAKKDNRTAEENQKIYEIQEKINQAVKDTGKQVELVTTKINEQGKEVTEVNTQYDVQLQKIKEIEREKEKARLAALKSAAEVAQENLANFGEQNLIEFFGSQPEWSIINHEIEEAGIKLSSLGDLVKDFEAYKDGSDTAFLNKMMEGKSLDAILDKANVSEQYKILANIKTQLEATGNVGSKAYAKISEMLEEIEERQNVANNAIQEYNDALKDMYDISGLLVDYQTVLSAIMDTYGESESVKNLTNELTSLNTQFANGKITTQEYFEGIKAKIDTIDFTDKTGEELEGLRAIFAETTRFIASSLEDIQNSFDDGEITFKNYVESLADANENLLELYATQNNLKLNNEGIWEGANQEAVEYANNLQAIQDQAESFIGVLQTLGESYDYIAENADAYGNAAFEVGDMVDQRYKTLATNFGNSLAQMRIDNEAAWTQITQHIFDNAGKQANEIADVDTYVTNALKTNNGNLNTALNEAARQSQEAASKLATNTGDLISALGDVIANFKYNIKFNVNGSIDPGGNILNLATGKSFKPTSDLTLSISGSAEEGSSVANLASKLKDWGASYKDYIASKSDFNSLLETISPYASKNNVSTTSPKTTSPSSTGKTGGSSSSKKDTSEEDAAKAAEEAYKARLKAFEDYVDEKERLEKRWVDKQKELGQLSNEDYLYITQQRIERYKKYLQEVKNATWLSAEDRLKLEKEYSEKIEDLQVGYLGYLQDQLDDEIEAIEDANEEKIKLIEEEAEAKINALKKVEDARDRDRDKEDYEKERQSILDEISYWEQRTGREAQEALKEAKEKLEELDAEWEDQLEDWSIEDQIQAIEDERDAQISAIEDAQEAEIASIKAVYDAKVKLFAETGEIIYENSVMQSQALYNAYKANFIDPISSELTKLNQASTATAPTTTTTTQKQYETYTIKSGDTLSKIAKKYGTTVDKIMAANPYVTNKNKIYAGKTLQIPKFHEGGIVGGTQEAFALLKPNEVVLKPTWAASLDRMMKHFDNVSAGTTNISNGSNIEVKGDLIKIEATVRNQSDIDLMTKKIERVLKDKFNIKK